MPESAQNFEVWNHLGQQSCAFLGPKANSDLSPLKRVSIQILAGCCASIVESAIFLPLDVVKTRLQLQNRTIAAQPHYDGVRDAFVKIYRYEGPSALWRGLFPHLASDLPKRLVKYVVFEQAKPLFLFGATQPTPLTYVLAAGLAGGIEGLVQTPFEVVKIVQQASLKNLRSISIAKGVIEQRGFRGLFAGAGVTMARNSIFHMAHFGLFFTVREATPAFEQPFYEFLRSFAIAFVAGLLGVVASSPVDTAKTRIQGPQPVAGQIKYQYMVQTILTVSQEEGWRSLFTGLLPTMMRVGPGGVILLVGYEFVSNILINLSLEKRPD